MNIYVNKLEGIIQALPQQFVIELPQGTIRDLINHLACRFGPEVAEELLRGRELDPHIYMLLNGRGIGSLQGLDTPLQDGDDLYILYLVAGG